MVRVDGRNAMADRRRKVSMTSAVSFAGANNVPSHNGFGSLIDLARLRFFPGPAEICDACNTINLGTGHYCKSCSHKLPAFFVAKGLGTPSLPQWRRFTVPRNAFAVDFAAFCIVINTLVVITKFIAPP